MNRVTTVLRIVALAALLVGAGFAFAPANADVDPLPPPQPTMVEIMSPISPATTDSLTEDIILFNAFSASRTAPARRSTGDTGDPVAYGDDPEPQQIAPSFVPVLAGTVVSARPEETRALLQLSAGDAGPRLYAAGESAGGYKVESIDTRSVVLSGPRGRIVLRLPEREENHS